MSFKLPHSWGEMAAGAGDAWAKNLAARFGRLNGPVWLAFHHEPEGDGLDAGLATDAGAPGPDRARAATTSP